ncbi:MAG: hypothetical protein HC865_24190 [Cyanobacteria bacterium RU_5_0]|nr:hypothetical protein [Cyanobacteria bacterium RU_5_0]
MPIIPKAIVKPGYRTQAEDTSIDADVFLFAQLRKLTLAQRTERFASFNRSVRQLTLANAPAGSKRSHYLKKRFGEAWFNAMLDLNGNIMIQDPIATVRKMAAILEPLHIPYYVGGSVASSLLGESRYTEDVDLVIEISQTQVQSLIQAFLNDEFYISETAIIEAVESSDASKSFNVINNESLEKIDLFVLKDNRFAHNKMARRRFLDLPEGGIYICSAEDIILQKLIWRNRSESQKQWRDVLGVLKVQVETLDYGYLADWADQLGVLDALNQALVEAGI